MKVVHPPRRRMRVLVKMEQQSTSPSLVFATDATERVGRFPRDRILGVASATQADEGIGDGEAAK